MPPEPWRNGGRVFHFREGSYSLKGRLGCKKSQLGGQGGKILRQGGGDLRVGLLKALTLHCQHGTNNSVAHRLRGAFLQRAFSVFHLSGKSTNVVSFLLPPAAAEKARELFFMTLTPGSYRYDSKLGNQMHPFRARAKHVKEQVQLEFSLKRGKRWGSRRNARGRRTEMQASAAFSAWSGTPCLTILSSTSFLILILQIGCGFCK